MPEKPRTKDSRGQAAKKAAGEPTKPAKRSTRRGKSAKKGAKRTKKPEKSSAAKGRRGRAGGAATEGGTAFQRKVAAWLSVWCLANLDLDEALGVASSTVCEMTAEGTTAVDDVVAIVQRGADGEQIAALVQVKADGSATSPVICQFVEQFHSLDHIAAIRRPFDAHRDRLVLLCGSQTSVPVRETLARVLDRLRLGVSPGITLRRALSDDEWKIVRRVVKSVRHAWKERLGSRPTGAELLTLAGCACIMQLNDANWSDARGVLRRLVLRDGNAEDAQRAWSRLLELWSDRAAAGGGQQSRTGLRSSLRDAGFALLHDADYESDIARLRAVTDRELRHLSSYATIELRDRTIHVQRDVLVPLRVAALEGPHLLITGTAGSGKSGLLHDLAVGIQADGIRAVVVSSDTLVSRPDWTFSLGLTHRLPDVLRAWDGVGEGFLFIDALDAVRLGARIQDLLNLIEDVHAGAPAWRVVVAVREFDLQHNARLQGLFRGTPIGAESPATNDLRDVRAFRVGAFNDVDASRLDETAPDLVHAARRVEPRFGASIWLPIHLRLLAGITSSTAQGADPEELRCPLDLWDRYWEQCVARSPSQGYVLALDREVTVEVIVAAMVRRRSLSLTPVDVLPAPSPGMLLQLVSDGVLRCVRRGGATHYEFTHHALFDYAASRVCFPIPGSHDLEPGGHDLDALFVFRPSLMLSFERLWWEASREEFWATALRWASITDSPSAVTVPAVIAGRQLRGVDDVAPLVARLERPDEFKHALDLLRFAATTAIQVERLPLAGDRALAWCEICACLASQDMPLLASFVTYLLANLTPPAPRMNRAQVAAAGAAARWLLAHALAERSDLLTHALCFVARTTRSSARLTSEALAPVLEPGQVAAQGYRSLQALSMEIEALIDAAPDLAGRIYRAAYGYRELSMEAGESMGGQIFSLVSYRRQDFQQARRQLAESFPRLLERDLAVGVSVLAAAGRFDDDLRPYSSDYQLVLSLHGHSIVVDLGWHRTWARADELEVDSPELLFRAFQAEIASLAETEFAAAAMRAIGSACAGETVPMRLLSALLQAGASAPQHVGLALRELLWSPGLLMCVYLGSDVPPFLAAVAPLLETDDRRRLVEAFEASLTPVTVVHTDQVDVAEAAPSEHALEMLATLAARLPAGFLSEELTSQLPRLEPEPQFPRRTAALGSAVEVSAGPPESVLPGAREPAPPEGLALAHAVAAVQSLTLAFRSPTDLPAPTWDQVSVALAALDLVLAESREVLSGAALERARRAELDLATRAVVAREVGDGEARERVRGILVAAATAGDPESDPEIESRMASRVYWYAESGRIAAAIGLSRLLGTPPALDHDVQHALEALARDAHPAVRLHAAGGLAAFPPGHERVALQMANQICRAEPNAEVAVAAWAAVFAWRTAALDEWYALADLLWERAQDGEFGEQSEDTANACAARLLEEWLRSGDDRGCPVLFAVRDAPWDHLAVAVRLALNLRRELRASSEQRGVDEDERHARAISLFTKLCAGARVAAERVLRAGADETVESDSSCAVTLGVALAQEVSFAAGRYHDERKGEAPSVPRAVRARLVRELGPAILDLAHTTVVRSAFRLLQGVSLLLDADPRACLRMARDVVVLGGAGGLGREKMASDVACRFVRRVLIEERALLAGTTASAAGRRRQMIEILDVFVESGQPEPVELVLRLHEATR